MTSPTATLTVPLTRMQVATLSEEAAIHGMRIGRAVPFEAFLGLLLEKGLTSTVRRRGPRRRPRPTVRPGKGRKNLDGKARRKMAMIIPAVLGLASLGKAVQETGHPGKFGPGAVRKLPVAYRPA